jgi:hypothetical protein
MRKAVLHSLAWVVALAALACGGRPDVSARPCQVQSQCDKGLACVAGLCAADPDAPTITLDTPADDGACAASGCAGAVVNAAASALAFSGTVADARGLQGALAITVTRDGTAVTQATADPVTGTWSWSWDTSALSDDGHAYVVSVTATNLIGNAQTATRTVWVDRVRPTVQATTPAASATGAWPLDPLQITFSEPVAAATVADASVTVLTGVTPTSKRLALSPDGRTLSMKLTAPPTTAGQMSVEYATGASVIADLAGNPLDPPSTAWVWNNAAIWVDLDSNQASVSNHTTWSVVGVSADAAGNALVLRNFTNTGAPAGLQDNLLVDQVNASQWTSLPSLANALADASQVVIDASVAGAPVVAWAQQGGGFSIERLQSSAWSSVSSIVGTPHSISALRIGADTNPIAAWIDSSQGSVAQVSHWDGLGWVAWGPLSQGPSSAVALALGAGSAPLAAWFEVTGPARSLFVATWNGSSWLKLGDALQSDASATLGDLSLGTDGQGRPLVLWSETSGSGLQLFLSSWDGSSWSRALLAPPCAGPFMIDGSAGVIALCSAASRWDGEDWISLGNLQPVGTFQGGPVFGRSALGWPVLAWADSNGPSPTFRVRRFNH